MLVERIQFALPVLHSKRCIDGNERVPVILRGPACVSTCKAKGHGRGALAASRIPTGLPMVAREA